ncbi:hypothetical protein V6667_06430 [Neisseria leonii]|uniref:Holin n=1 Tax=Neisseria leonii TaxID=2995413 RepID=A0A9X4IDZ8_9NEIS|nr:MULTISPECIES: hypothetical protein [unclassified Neisseria]MDD9324735.1 hypothetical protein [Neisseria sp. 3986]MDD9327702.1 hypothetical protein [Neisseria sp. 51.81]
MRNKHTITAVLLYLLLAPPALAAVKDSFHGALNSMIAWDLMYNMIGGAGGGMVQVARNWHSERKYSNNIAVELFLSLFVSAFAGLLTYLFFAGTEFITINSIMMLFLSCCAGVLGYEAVKMYTDDFAKKVKKGSPDDA